MPRQPALTIVDPDGNSTEIPLTAAMDAGPEPENFHLGSCLIADAHHKCTPDWIEQGDGSQYLENCVCGLAAGWRDGTEPDPVHTTAWTPEEVLRHLHSKVTTSRVFSLAAARA